MVTFKVTETRLQVAAKRRNELTIARSATRSLAENLIFVTLPFLVTRTEALRVRCVAVSGVSARAIASASDSEGKSIETSASALALFNSGRPGPCLRANRLRSDRVPRLGFACCHSVCSSAVFSGFFLRLLRFSRATAAAFSSVARASAFCLSSAANSPAASPSRAARLEISPSFVVGRYAPPANFTPHLRQLQTPTVSRFTART